MKSWARLALILACMALGLSLLIHLVRFLPAFGLPGQSMVMVYNILGPLSTLLHVVPIIILSLVVMRMDDERWEYRDVVENGQAQERPQG